TGEICSIFADKDSRIVIMKKANEGVSAARNDGIRLSKGHNIIFCDADDIMMPNALFQLGVLSEIDFVLGSYHCTPSNKKEVFPDITIDDLKEIGLFIRQNIFKGFSTPW